MIDAQTIDKESLAGISDELRKNAILLESRGFKQQSEAYLKYAERIDKAAKHLEADSWNEGYDYACKTWHKYSDDRMEDCTCSTTSSAS